MEEKFKKIIIVLLTIIVMLILFIFAIVILKKQGIISFNKNNTSKNGESEKISIDKIAGEYVAEFNNLKVEEASSNNTTFTLRLYKNGVFSYRYSGIYVPQGVIGNYIINGNKIILTTWFNTGSSTDLIVANGSKELIFNDDNNIIDDNIKIKLITDNGINKATLIKTSNAIGDFDITNLLSGACFYDECGKQYDSNM